jgi:hypothetical protein
MTLLSASPGASFVPIKVRMIDNHAGVPSSAKTAEALLITYSPSFRVASGIAGFPDALHAPDRRLRAGATELLPEVARTLARLFTLSACHWRR